MIENLRTFSFKRLPQELFHADTNEIIEKGKPHSYIIVDNIVTADNTTFFFTNYIIYLYVVCTIPANYFLVHKICFIIYDGLNLSRR